MTMLQGKTAAVIMLILLVVAVFFAWTTISLQKELTVARAAVNEVQFNKKVLDFADLFVEKVLKAKQEVSFEDRLSLETVVRDLDDAEILYAWNKFVNSKTEAEAQDGVKNLLGLLVKKVKT